MVALTNKIKNAGIHLFFLINKAFLKLLGRQNMNKFFVRFFKACEMTTNEFYAVLKRPKNSNGVISIASDSYIHSQSSIIMQGPLVADDNFTLESVRTYAKLYPGVLIIVSTWENEDEELVQRLNQEPNCCVVKSVYPKYSGLLNINYQVVTTIEGIRKAKEMGKLFVFKTRSDYRLYKKGLIEYLYCLIHDYPIASDIKYQKYRIIAGGEIRDSMFRAFWLADQFNYGYIDDMLSYWNYELKNINMDKNQVWSIIKSEHLSWRERTERGLAAEPDIVLDYLRRMEGIKPNCTVREYWRMISKQFILVSKEEIGSYWYKYQDKYDESACKGTYFAEDTYESLLSYNWDYIHWLLLYRGLLRYDEKFERYSECNRY